MIDDDDLDQFMQSQAIVQRYKLISEQQIKIMELEEELERYKNGINKAYKKLELLEHKLKREKQTS